MPGLDRSEWPNRTAVVIAPGPSLTESDVFEVLRRRANDSVRVIAVSNAWKLTSAWADVFYAADRRYWVHYVDKMINAGCHLQKMHTCCSMSAQTYGINRVKCANKPGLGIGMLHSGGNSGYQAINLAHLFGARRIVLTGFDMQTGLCGLKHFDGSHPAPLVQDMAFPEWIHRFDKLAEDLKEHGVEVLNCTRSTALFQFPLANLEDALPPIPT